MKREIAAAAADDPTGTKYLLHDAPSLPRHRLVLPPRRSTPAGSAIAAVDDRNSKAFYNELKGKYPQLVHFSGHTHIPEDPRSTSSRTSTGSRRCRQPPSAITSGCVAARMPTATTRTAARADTRPTATDAPPVPAGRGGRRQRTRSHHPGAWTSARELVWEPWTFKECPSQVHLWTYTHAAAGGAQPSPDSGGGRGRAHTGRLHPRKPGRRSPSPPIRSGPTRRDCPTAW